MNMEMDGKSVVYFGDFKTVKTSSESNDTAIYRVALQNEEEAARWLLEYEKKTRTKYIVYRTLPDVERSLFCKKWVCQHSSRYKKTKEGCKSRFTGRNAECPAKLSIKIKKVNRSTKKNDPYLKLNPPLQAVISVDLKHSHNLESADMMRLLRPTAETKEAFINMFDSGMKPSESRRLHESKLLLQENGIELIANGSINPPERTVRMWHQEWRQKSFGPQVAPLDKIKEKTPVYKKDGVDVFVAEVGNPEMNSVTTNHVSSANDTTTANCGVKTNEAMRTKKAHGDGIKRDLWAVLIVSPIMKRTQELQCASELVFIDSTKNLDTAQCSLTVFLAATPGGAVPIAVLIHSNHRIAGYEMAFSLLKSLYSSCFGGQNAPKFFMTDNSSALKSAVKAVWPGANQLLCHFHLNQAEWRWLLSSKNNVSHKDRKIYLKCFQNIMYASSTEELKKAQDDFFQTVTDDKYVKRVKDLLETSGEEWILLFRNFELTWGLNTNNFAEAAIRVLKDIVLCRLKTLNPAAIVDFVATVWEEYFVGCLLAFANNRRPTSGLLYSKLLNRMPAGSENYIERLDDNTYQVPSGKTGVPLYEVQADIGWCSCLEGKQGAFCKHQVLVHEKFGGLFPDAPPTTSKDRYTLAKLALGADKCPPPAFFLTMADNREATTAEISVDHAANQEEDVTPPYPLDDEDPVCPILTVEDSSLDNELKSLQEQEDFSKEMIRVFDLVKDHAVFKRHCGRITHNLKNIKTIDAAVEAFLRFGGLANSSTPRTRPGGYIKIRPMPLGRLREGPTQGSKRVAAGRPQMFEPPSKQVRIRLHELLPNVQENVPHTKYIYLSTE